MVIQCEKIFKVLTMKQNTSSRSVKHPLYEIVWHFAPDAFENWPQFFLAAVIEFIFNDIYFHPTHKYARSYVHRCVDSTLLSIRIEWKFNMAY